MGSGLWDNVLYASTVRTAYAGVSREELFSSKVDPDFDPAKILMRESRDSEDNPNSTAIIVGLDQTGSMGKLAEDIAKGGLGKLVEGIHKYRPVSDPHIMMMGLGDATCDRSPLQVTQFEADLRISEQLVRLYLEGAGGGNGFETYDLAWLFAAKKTSIDCFEKRGVKGYLFTIGDEPGTPAQNTYASHHLDRYGLGEFSTMTPQSALLEAREMYNIFHLVILQGSHCSNASSRERTLNYWGDLLGRRVLQVINVDHIPEIIVSAIMVNEGKDTDDVINSWEDPGIMKSVKYSIFGE